VILSSNKTRLTGSLFAVVTRLAENHFNAVGSTQRIDKGMHGPAACRIAWLLESEQI